MEFNIINAIINKLLESKWRPSGSRDSDSQSKVRHRLRQLFFIYGFAPTWLSYTVHPQKLGFSRVSRISRVRVWIRVSVRNYRYFYCHPII